MYEKLSPQHKYYYPLPKKQMQQFFKKIFGPPILGQSITINFSPPTNKDRALIKFCWANRYKLCPKGPIKKRLQESPIKHIYLDTKTAVCNTEQDFWRLFLRHISYAKDVNKNKEVCRGGMGERLRDLIPQNRTIISFRGIDHLTFTTKTFWQKIYSLRYCSLINFQFIFYRSRLELNKIVYHPIYRFLNQNKYQANVLDQKTKKYVIKRWGILLNYEFSKTEIEEIIKYSKNSFALIKEACCTIVQHHGKKSVPKILDKKKANKQSQLLQTINDDITVNFKTKEIFKGDKNITCEFSSMEQKLLLYLLQNINKTLSREQLALICWGKQYHNSYSDNAINQYIYRLRQKLVNLNLNTVKIKTVYAKGYLLHVTNCKNPSQLRDH
jgi:DNA-binding winged helix-turn-helix (wHTH) protein